MPITINGSGTVTGITAGGLPSATVTQATLATPVAGTGPAFRATLSANQNISVGTRTKVALNTKTFDTATCFDATTNYRFTPNVAGYYQVNGIVGFTGTLISASTAEIRKNGTGTATTYFFATAASNIAVVDLIYLNGSTDYIELWGQINASSGAQFTTDTVFSASLVRAA